MNQQWQQFLQTLHLYNLPGTAGCALMDLSQQGVIRVQGADARDFLQGQLTSDINQVTPTQAQLSAYCTPKGRMLAILLIFQRGDDLYLLLPGERLEPVLKRLRMFVLRSKVTLDDLSGEWASVGLAGDCLGGIVNEVPETAFATAHSADLTSLRMPGETARVLVMGETDSMTAFWQKAAALATVTSSDYWHLLNIRAGIPTLLDATVEAFIPQMANLDLLGAISFTKGCYTGQEVVARMKYLGQLKRRMYLARLETEQPPRPGDKLFSPASKSAQGAGRILDARPSPDGGFEALVVVEISSAEAGGMRLGDENGPLLTLRAPPYGLSSEEESQS